ncbi:MAG: imidazole glycerol phosphate synthase subunit HisF [Thalassospira sp.]|nr:imidazole glycerol phosphate synthase subunit HisF [Thalassospira sp.]MBO6817231.1 imidazole glycerol phosphate synthase subunit HisF [Thalassospira sp.]QPO11188.1 imidazole glycerol phosphate synthase subunit HisF [Thalassospira sp. A40-3]
MIPCLLIADGGLVKTTGYKRPSYVGDPINAVRIFNSKEVDELMVLDISASKQGRAPDFNAIGEIVSEAFMPVAYGGGITTERQAGELLALGVEKVVLNSILADDPGLVSILAKRFGSQSVVVSIDVKKQGITRQYHAMTHGGTRKTGQKPKDFAQEMVMRGAGEILLNAIDQDGTLSGYDLQLINEVASCVDIPIVACGGARDIADFEKATKAGASAVAAGSFFIYHGPHRAVLISYPNRSELENVLP